MQLKNSGISNVYAYTNWFLQQCLHFSFYILPWNAAPHLVTASTTFKTRISTMCLTSVPRCLGMWCCVCISPSVKWSISHLHCAMAKIKSDNCLLSMWRERLPSNPSVSSPRQHRNSQYSESLVLSIPKKDFPPKLKKEKHLHNAPKSPFPEPEWRVKTLYEEWWGQWFFKLVKLQCPMDWLPSFAYASRVCQVPDSSTYIPHRFGGCADGKHSANGFLAKLSRTRGRISTRCIKHLGSVRCHGRPSFLTFNYHIVLRGKPHCPLL